MSERFRPWWLLPPLAAGAALRLWQVREQVLGGDELHTVRTALGLPLAKILVTYREADPSIPLAAFYRLLIDQGARLSETALRVPMLAAGLLLLALAPIVAMTAGSVGRRAAALFAWLVAVSPVLVLFSRIVRSYMPMLLCAAVAAWAFWMFWRTRGARGVRGCPWGLAYVLAGGLAVWLHLGSAPFVAAPFLFALGDLALTPAGPGGRRLRGLLPLTLVGLGFATVCLVFLLPARESLLRLVSLKRQAQEVPWSAVRDVLLLQAGTGEPVLAALFWGLALGGIALLLRDRPRLGAYTLTLAMGQAVGIRVLSPVGITHPWVLDRYLLPSLLLVLLWVAYALARPWWRQQGRPGGAFQAAVAGGFVLALALAGPFADRGFRSSSFMHHDDLAGFYGRAATVAPAAVPAFYRRLAEEGADDAVLEYPWLFLWRFRAFYLYQQVHGRRVIVASPQRLVRHPGLALENAVADDPAAFCASDARWLVVHLHMAREEERLRRPGGRAAPMSPELRRRLRLGAGRMARRLVRRWGAPVYADRTVRVWDLERSCAP